LRRAAADRENEKRLRAIRSASSKRANHIKFGPAAQREISEESVQSYAMTLLLKEDPRVVEHYKAEHQRVWPEVLARLRECGITEMRIYLLGSRMFMYYEASDSFDPNRDLPRLTDDPTYRRWDELMRTMQEPVVEAKPEEWWAKMEPVFDLNWPQHRP
jgi:L-rhamnose mutarotase